MDRSDRSSIWMLVSFANAAFSSANGFAVASFGEEISEEADDGAASAPSTKTKRRASKSSNSAFPSGVNLPPEALRNCRSDKRRRSVYFQASSVVVGKPRERNFANASR